MGKIYIDYDEASEVISNIKSIANDFVQQKLCGLSINEDYYEAILRYFRPIQQKKRRKKQGVGL